MENEANEGSNQAGEGSNQSDKVNDSAELIKRIEQLEQSNKRLLEESKGYKEKYKAVSGEISKKEEEIALKQGDLQRLLEIERNKTAERESELNTLREKILAQEIKNTVSKYATDAISLDDVLNQPSFSPVLKEAIDKETLSVNEEKAKEFVEQVRKAKAHLFKTANQPGVVTKKPGQNNGKPKSLSEMNTDEIKAALKSGLYK
jgi:DNA repair exonuclease SbcCD ATPase subunit